MTAGIDTQHLNWRSRLGRPQQQRDAYAPPSDHAAGYGGLSTDSRYSRRLPSTCRITRDTRWPSSILCRHAARRGAAPQTNDPDDNNGDEPKAEAFKTVVLPKSGGSLTLSANINFFELVDDERTLVFSLIDAMRKFEMSLEGGA